MLASLPEQPVMGKRKAHYQSRALEVPGTGKERLTTRAKRYVPWE